MGGLLEWTGGEGCRRGLEERTGFEAVGEDWRGGL